MPGVDGAVKLNSFRAPSTKNSETKVTVSEFVVQEETVVETNEKEPEEINNEPFEEVVEEPGELVGETVEEVVELIEIEKPVEEIVEAVTDVVINQSEVENVKSKKKKEVDLKTLFLAVENIVQKMYGEVFSKTPNFKPSFETTMGDLILYISKKLSLKNADSEFNAVFGLTGKVLPDKYSNGYIPYALKLSKWLGDNGKMLVSEDLMFAISTVYLESSKRSNVIITELELANDFEIEISYAL